MNPLSLVRVDKTALPWRYQEVLSAKDNLSSKIEFIPINFANQYADDRLVKIVAIIFLGVVVFGVILDLLQHKSPSSYFTFFVCVICACLLGIIFLGISIRQKSLQQKTFFSLDYKYGLYIFNDAILLYDTENVCSWWSVQSIVGIKTVVTGHKPAVRAILISYHAAPNADLEYFYLPQSLQGYSHALEKRLKDWYEDSKNKFSPDK